MSAPRLRPWWRLAAAVLFAVVAATRGAPAEDGAKRLQSVELELERARVREADLGREAAALAREVAGLREKMIAAAHDAQEREDEITALEGRLAELDEAYGAKTRDLLRRRAQLAGTLEALVRIALVPPAAAIALPGRPVDALRGALLLRVALPSIEGRARELRSELDDLKALRSEMRVWRRELAGAVAGLQAERDSLDGLIARKTSLAQETKAERKAARDRMTALVAEAKDLRELLDRLGAEAPPVAPPESARPGAAAEVPVRLSKPDGIRPIEEARGRMLQAARGRQVRAYGQADEFGGTEKGITIETRGGARVVAPFDGQVVFAGPFRRYGQILIIDHGEGYHSLLAGLARLDAVAGQWVLAGEPVGVMGRPSTGSPRLYVELRREGRPVDPVPWLLAGNE